MKVPLRLCSSLGGEESFGAIPFQLVLPYTITDLAIQILAFKNKNSYRLLTVNVQTKLTLGSLLFMNSLADFLWTPSFFLPKVFRCSWQSSLWFIHWASSVMTQAYVVREINISNCKGSDLEDPAHRHSLGQPLQVPPLFWGPGRQCFISQKLAPRNTPSGRRKGQTDVEENVLEDIVEESWMCKLICRI